jgi:hypothetical protein
MMKEEALALLEERPFRALHALKFVPEAAKANGTWPRGGKLNVETS